MEKYIDIKGASVHNLKHIDVKIPKDKLTVITGVSGSGKSSLAFDILYEEGRRRYLMFSNAQFMVDNTAGFENISGLSPTVAVEQRIIRQSNPRSTVGTRTKLSNMLAVMFATYGERAAEYDDGMPLEMAMFQKNSPKGMCVKCLGKGTCQFLNEDRLFGNPDMKLSELLYGVGRRGKTKRELAGFYGKNGLASDMLMGTLTEQQMNTVKYGDGGKSAFPGYIPWILRITQRGGGRLLYLLSQDGLIGSIPCPKCGGSGLNEYAAHTYIKGKTIIELENMYIRDLFEFFKNNKLSLSGENLIKEMMTKLECMIDVGLHHISLSRPVPTLSGGEIQRLFLASYIIAEMDSVIFVFDEPTIGLHEVEKAKLINILKKLVSRGNTVIAVEHDENFMRAADYIVDLGPYAGEFGGSRIYQGGYVEFMSCKDSQTAPYLSGGRSLPRKSVFKETEADRLLTIHNASIHNLRGLTVSIPLGLMVGVAGVSGSGKSSLISDTLVPKLKELLNTKTLIADDDEDENDEAEEMTAGELSGVTLSGTEHIKKCLIIDQKPIGRSRTSCPATYTSIFDRVRVLFAKTPEAVAQGFTPGLFTVNSTGGCRVCRGDGVIHYHVGYGNFIDLECETCGGTGFLHTAMEIRLDGKNIRDILEMSVVEAIDFFRDKDKIILRMLQTLDRVGMGYIRLGQKTPTISGGEAQRIKLAKELGKGGAKTKGNVYILDEPTTGLAFSDAERLIKLMQELVDGGNTVIVTEHDPAVLSNCDYIIELGPGGGSDGGYLLAAGTPDELRSNAKSIIGRYLK